MKNKSVEFSLLAIVIFQILLLTSLSISHSYQIHQTDPALEKSIAESFGGSLVKKGINLLTGFLSIKEIGIVSAQSDVSEEKLWCCEELNSATCQSINPGDSCDGETWMTKCDSTNMCKTGTCVDKDEGACSVGTKKECGENWQDKGINKVNECQFGCCTLDGGVSKEFVRKIKCVKEDGSFDPSVSERNCRIYTKEMGACLIGEDNCKFTTEEDCETNLNGDFRLGLLCSNPSLETVCEKPSSQNTKTTCYNDKVYFLDTCGNLANIYDSSIWNDENYWSFIQEPSSSCASGANFKSPNCGNCDGMQSACSSVSEAGGNPKYGNYVCKDLRCHYKDENEKTVIRQNQESWCVYESYVGGLENPFEAEYSKDVVGSEYRIRWCDRGEVKSDLCGNWRGKVCGERVIELEGYDDFSIARCRFNEGWKCLQVAIEYEYNDKGEIINEKEVEKAKEECNEISDCRVQSVDLYAPGKNEFIKFDVCVSKYPPGLEFWDSDGNADDICSLATIKEPGITTVWKKGLIGKWECDANCEALTQEFAEQMNAFCISLGDCGGYVNVEGEYTKNFKTFNINQLDENDFDIEDYDANGDISKNKEKEYESYADDDQIGNGDLPKFFSSTEEGSFGGDPLDIDFTNLDEILNTINVLIAAGIFGGAGYGIVSIFISSFTNVVAIIIGILFAILILIFGKWQTKEIEIAFECNPWEAPTGGNFCDKCNDDPLRPCTEYKCRSLGTGCRLIGEDELYDSENPVCFYKYKNDVTAPVILSDKIEGDYDFFNENKNKNVEIRTSEEEECIQEFSPINFTLKTENEKGAEDYAKCVYNWKHVDLNAPDYELDGEYFKEGNYFSVKHTFEQRLPRVTDINPQDITGNVPGEREGELNMYVRCMDYSGNFNANEYVVNFCIKEGPDNTAAIIKEFAPEDKSFLAYGNTTKELTISLDEPAECKWNLGADNSYENMANEFDCIYSEDHPELGGTCTATLTGLVQPENKIYIKCKDQPWISDPNYDGPWNEENRNVNEGGFEYTLYSTATPLQISSISPMGELIRGGEENQINLEVITSGGMNKGISTCKYEFVESPSEISSWDLFSQKDSSHSYPFNLNSGHYNILITCWDDAENAAQDNAIFDLIVDSSPPMVVRIYKDGSDLKIVTNEDAKCYYDEGSCSFDLEKGISMTTAFSKTHTTKWNPGITYYIKCKDIFENINSDCASRVIPSS